MCFSVEYGVPPPSFPPPWLSPIEVKMRGGLGVPEMSRKKGHEKDSSLEGSTIEAPNVVNFCCHMFIQ